MTVMGDAQDIHQEGLSDQACLVRNARTIAHLSDLHIGKSPKHLKMIRLIHDALISRKIDKIIVTGDITEHGLNEEIGLFMEIFDDFTAQNKIVIVPGNHDRWGDDVGYAMMNGDRVATIREDGMCLISIDSTEPRNHFKIIGHGNITEDMIQTIERTVDDVADRTFVVMALHHHLLPQPEDMWVEKISNWLHLPFAQELLAGQELIERLRGKCNLILHGHRHTLKETTIAGDRMMSIYNAGATTSLGGFRVFTYLDGSLMGEPQWISVR